MSQDTSQGSASSPLRGVIWCRQVDNEAESPRYIPYPESFPGLTESLPRMRFVGDLAINQSDTNDYWDPDPTRNFSYYRNLFLFPSGGGRYLCLGRMFLSTEERPRLGIKTLVLDAPRIFGGRNAARTLWQWYQAMEGATPRPTPKPGNPTFATEVAESFAYGGLGTEAPLVVLLTEMWGNSAETIFSIMDRVPESSLAFSGILLFPYFIPAAKVNISQWNRFFPLSLAAFRLNSRSTLDQRKRWAEGWSNQKQTVVDLSLPGATSQVEISAPARVWSEEGSADRWALLKATVDGPELEAALIADFPPEEGPYRRQQLARLTESMGEALSPTKKRPKGARKPEAATVLAAPVPVPNAPEEVSATPPWLESSKRTRVDKVGVAGGGIAKLLTPPPPPKEVPPLPTPAPVALPFELPKAAVPVAAPAISTLSAEDIQRIVNERVNEELARFLTGDNPIFADRFSQMDRLKADLKDLDDRLKYFAERTLPLIRKTWTKVGELKVPTKGGGPAPKGEEVDDIKDELWQELHRMEDEFAARTEEILERMESTLQTQGRIWLTLVKEVERLSGQRQRRPSSGPPPSPSRKGR